MIISYVFEHVYQLSNPKKTNKDETNIKPSLNLCLCHPLLVNRHGSSGSKNCAPDLRAKVAW